LAGFGGPVVLESLSFDGDAGGRHAALDRMRDEGLWDLPIGRQARAPRVEIGTAQQQIAFRGFDGANNRVGLGSIAEH
jgi:hypothetical protein